MRKHEGKPSRRDKYVTLAAISPSGVARSRFVGGHQSGLAGRKPPPLFTRGVSSCSSQRQRQRDPWGASPRPVAPTYLPTLAFYGHEVFDPCLAFCGHGVFYLRLAFYGHGPFYLRLAFNGHGPFYLRLAFNGHGAFYPHLAFYGHGVFYPRLAFYGHEAFNIIEMARWTVTSAIVFLHAAVHEIDATRITT